MIRHVSKARAKQWREYEKLKPEFLLTHEICFVCGAFVPLVARWLHHFYKRRGELLCWVPGFRMAEWPCHERIHADESHARTMGWLAPKECCDDFARAKSHHEQQQTK